MEKNAGLTSNEMLSNLDNVKVMENGVEIIDPNRIRPDVMQFVMLAKMARETIKIRKYFDDRIPSGYIQAIAVAATPVRQLVELSWIAQSVSCINDGLNPVFVWVNTLERPPHQINPAEAFNINFEVHKLRRLYFQCGPALATAVRVVAMD